LIRHPVAASSTNPVRLRLAIAFDGTQYAGWQLQESGVAVQGVLEQALARLFPSRPRVHGSSRTDSGVHALGLVAHFDVPADACRMAPSKLLLAINAHLPEDVRVLAVRRVGPGFHARFQARSKQYRYFVWNHPAMNPLLRQQAWHVPRRLDLAAMRTAARQFVGRHDFRAFTANRRVPLEDAVRTLTRCDVRRQGALVTFTIEGTGFLYKMCRAIVGTLVQLGQGKLTEEKLRQVLASRDRTQAGMTAPAHGLVLWRVTYRKGRNQTPDERPPMMAHRSPRSGPTP
jgi:tRNA pseudouridine38-40 synthase